jgi:hypothetical protein
MIHTIINNNYKYYGEQPIKDIKYYGKIFYSDGSSYQGHFINGNKHGYGEEKTNDGYHCGFYNDGILHGKAITYIKSKGSYIDGYYQNGKLNGECMFYNEKSTLLNKGMFKDGKSCVATYEVIKNKDGSKLYEGYIYDDKYNGFGKLYKNDIIYIGNFTAGCKDGKFLICYNNNTTRMKSFNRRPLLPFSYHFLFARIREVFQVQILISLLIGR